MMRRSGFVSVGDPVRARLQRREELLRLRNHPVLALHVFLEDPFGVLFGSVLVGAFLQPLVEGDDLRWRNALRAFQP